MGDQEITNLYHQTACQDIVQALRRRVTEWMVGTAHPTTDLPMPPTLAASGSVGPSPLPEDGRVPPSRLVEQVRDGRSRNYL